MWKPPVFIKPDIERQRTIFLTGMTPEQIAAEETIKERLKMAISEGGQVVCVDSLTGIAYANINEDYRNRVKFPLEQKDYSGGLRAVTPIEL